MGIILRVKDHLRSEDHLRFGIICGAVQYLSGDESPVRGTEKSHPKGWFKLCMLKQHRQEENNAPRKRHSSSPFPL